MKRQSAFLQEHFYSTFTFSTAPQAGEWFLQTTVYIQLYSSATSTYSFSKIEQCSGTVTSTNCSSFSVATSKLFLADSDFRSWQSRTVTLFLKSWMLSWKRRLVHAGLRILFSSFSSMARKGKRCELKWMSDMFYTVCFLPIPAQVGMPELLVNKLLGITSR